MKFSHARKIVWFALLFVATQSFGQQERGEQSVLLRLGQGVCVTMPTLHTSYLSSSLAFSFAKHQWLQVRLEGSVDLLEDHHGNKDFIIGAVPTAAFTAHDLPLSPFLELACGINYVSNIYLSGRALGSNFLFSPTVSGGIHLSENFMGISIEYTFRHLSNASLYDDNDGINLQYVTVSYGL